MKKILVIQTASIGDAILATALLEKLHNQYPSATIDFLVKAGIDPLFRGHPFIHHLYIWDKSKKIRDIIRLIREIRSATYDLVINLQRFALTGVLTVLSGAQTTRGFDKNPLSMFYTNRFPHPIGKGIHETNRNQNMIADLSGKEPAKPRLYPEHTTLVRALIQQCDPEPYYTISPASLWFTKQFPPERWVELIRLMPPSATVYLLGSNHDRPLCDHILNLFDKPSLPLCESPPQKPLSSVHLINLAGSLSLLESAALMQQARMNFTNDSAPMHLASAVNAPVCTIFCSTTPDFGFGPLSETSLVIQTREQLSCRPCGLHGYQRCPEIHFDCARNIDIRDLEKALST